IPNTYFIYPNFAVFLRVLVIFVYVMRPIKSILNNNLPKKTEISKNMLYGIVFYLAGLKKGSIFASLS
uniref:hypothetical protein n=1 Tax=Phocaeicola dorei TaxID=357276 RepID=UPI0040293642